MADTRQKRRGSEEDSAPRLAVRKTYKLYVGGSFPRSESGRSYPVASPEGEHLGNASLASRKDARDAVSAARAAFGGWSARSAHNRGQILYRVAEMLESRRKQFVAELEAADGENRADPRRAVEAAIDRWVYYAGWTDKFAHVLGGANQVSGSYASRSTPEPTGVVAVLAPQDSPLLGLVSVLAPVVATGNTAVVVASETAPLPAVTLGEVLANSDLPGGVANILTGRTADLAGHLAAHADVNALDLAGAGDAAAELEATAAGTLKRVLRPEREPEWFADPGIARLASFLETKTVWHPIGT
ncbi:aldehyde dehydrogenase family protein [Haloactinospora alba]|uniref:Aldehyde dehydrogenase family protein n=1 Tax=Haloactinospora alba TaxID=405555 RepID=A0A543NGP4_9ACTN|nr:aldehyde dehydrogenase family protein [Haloactinospora alba]TQN30983.1 aldehyde dehydrogenase family protein [Haloactinospora alba]